MQLKNSLLLLTALSAGTAVGRMHAHERRHMQIHQQREQEAVEKRAVGDWVTAKINGKYVSWQNTYDGGAAATAAPAPAEYGSPSATVVVPTGTASASATASRSADDGQFTWQGFGGRTAPSGSGVSYRGNVGNPWGSNIIEIPESEKDNYKYVVHFEPPADGQKWTVTFWNKIGPDGKMTGWYGNSALTFSIGPGENKYVAFDEDSQGAWGAAPGDSLPKDQYGGYSCTWGEFDFGSSINGGYSGWDVSAIQAQAAHQTVQGMQICEENGSGCSSISDGASQVIDAYTYDLKAVDGIGGQAGPGPVRLRVVLGWNGGSSGSSTGSSSSGQTYN